MNAIIDANIFLVVVAAAAVALGLLQASAIDDLRKRTRRLGRIEAKLDLLMENAGIEFGPYESLPAQVVDALNRDEKIKAIKFYMSAAGVSLKEAKNVIEDIQRRSGF
jgi:ribosomal protein L7/L12